MQIFYENVANSQAKIIVDRHITAKYGGGTPFDPEVPSVTGSAFLADYFWESVCIDVLYTVQYTKRRWEVNIKDARG